MTSIDELLKRITVRPDVFGGKPTIRNMRIAVEHVFAMLAAGDTPEAILREYDFLEPADIQACFLYAYRVTISRQALAKHIDVLEKAGLVSSKEAWQVSDACLQR